MEIETFDMLQSFDIQSPYDDNQFYIIAFISKDIRTDFYGLNFFTSNQSTNVTLGFCVTDRDIRNSMGVSYCWDL